MATTRSRSRSRAWWLALLLLLPAIPAGAADEDVISATVERFFGAWNRHDGKAMAELFDEDSDYGDPSGKIAKGRREVEKAFITDQNERMVATIVTRETFDPRPIGQGLASVDSDFMLQGELDGGKQLSAGRQRAFFILRKKAGAWVILSLRRWPLK